MMPKAVCPACHETISGWILTQLDNISCVYCGAPIKKEEVQEA